MFKEKKDSWGRISLKESDLILFSLEFNYILRHKVFEQFWKKKKKYRENIIKKNLQIRKIRKKKISDFYFGNFSTTKNFETKFFIPKLCFSDLHLRLLQVENHISFFFCFWGNKILWKLIKIIVWVCILFLLILHYSWPEISLVAYHSIQKEELSLLGQKINT